MSERVTILGAGESGVGAAVLAKSVGARVFVSDKGAVKPRYRTELDALGVDWEEQQHTEDRIMASDLIIKSPGIPGEVPVVQQARQKGIPVISEVEYAARYTDAEIVAITGSNGKTTCTALTGHVFARAGLKVCVAGNIGSSFAREVATGGYDYYVVEVSSFQLDDIDRFKPRVSVLLNITPDHLDRYQNSFEKYAAAKFRIAENQDEGDYFIYCTDDAGIMENRHQLRSGTVQQMPFSYEYKPGSVGYTQHDKFIINYKNRFEMSIGELALGGKHNVYNSLAACIAARIYDIKKEVVRESLSDFKSLEHRLEGVTKVAGVEYINDSKATNVNSTWYALETMNRPVVWIAGGVDKGNDYSVLQGLVKQKVKAIVCLGENNIRIHEAFSRYVDVIVNTTSMPEAVRMSRQLAERDDVVLLSPACASFDLFENFEDRGEQFKAAVRSL